MLLPNYQSTLSSRRKTAVSRRATIELIFIFKKKSSLLLRNTSWCRNLSLHSSKWSGASPTRITTFSVTLASARHAPDWRRTHNTIARDLCQRARILLCSVVTKWSAIFSAVMMKNDLREASCEGRSGDAAEDKNLSKKLRRSRWFCLTDYIICM